MFDGIDGEYTERDRRIDDALLWLFRGTLVFGTPIAIVVGVLIGLAG